MQPFWVDKKAMHEQHKHSQRVRDFGRIQRRDEKRAGRAGPPDCEEIKCKTETGPAELMQTHVETRKQRGDNMTDWDIVGEDERLHSPAEWLAGGVLAQCRALAHLDLSWNGIETAGAASLEGVLGQCVALAHLNLSEQ